MSIRRPPLVIFKARYLPFKRAMDAFLAGLLIIIMLPLLILISALVFYSDGRPVFFRQKRTGINGQPFTLVKFRSMSFASDNAGNPLPDKYRISLLGQMLRSTSLDELPSLFNILCGEMSFVGPRPLLVEYLPLYSTFQKQRLSVRPGLTGLAQVSGRNQLSWTQKFEYDVSYVNNISFVFDLLILLKTFACVLKRTGINSVDGTAPPAFNGHN